MTSRMIRPGTRPATQTATRAATTRRVKTRCQATRRRSFELKNRDSIPRKNRRRLSPEVLMYDVAQPNVRCRWAVLQNRRPSRRQSPTLNSPKFLTTLARRRPTPKAERKTTSTLNRPTQRKRQQRRNWQWQLRRRVYCLRCRLQFSFEMNSIRPERMCFTLARENGRDFWTSECFPSAKRCHRKF